MASTLVIRRVRLDDDPDDFIPQSRNIQFFPSELIVQNARTPEANVIPEATITVFPEATTNPQTKSSKSPSEILHKSPTIKASSTPVQSKSFVSIMKPQESQHDDERLKSPPTIQSVPISKLSVPWKSVTKVDTKLDSPMVKSKKGKNVTSFTPSKKKTLELPDSPVSFLEEKRGIPVDMTDPIECSVIESTMIEKAAEIRNKSKDDALRHYLCNGYVVYIKWLQSKMQSVKLSDKDQSMAVFCVARDINKYEPTKRPMGIDIDIFAIMYEQWNHTDADRSLCGLVAKVVESFSGVAMNGKRISKTKIQKLALQFINCPVISMSINEFKKRLHGVSTSVLDEHSSNIWRGTVGLINCHQKGSEQLDDLIIDLRSIRNGQPMAPLPGFHLGIRMLEMEGIIEPTSPMTPYTPTRKVVVLS